MKNNSQSWSTNFGVRYKPSSLSSKALNALTLPSQVENELKINLEEKLVEFLVNGFFAL